MSAALALDDARALRTLNETGSFIFASIAIDVGFRLLLLQPIVYGLVHTDSAAALITRLAIATKDTNLVKILLDLLAAHGGSIHGLIGVRVVPRPCGHS